MKILVANKMDWKHPRAGGVEVNLRETLTRLADRGHEVHFVTSKFPGAESHEEIDGVHVHRYGLPGRTNEMFALTIGQLYFNNWIRKLEPDAIYTVNSLMSWIPLSGRDRHVVSIHHLNGRSALRQFDFPLNWAGYIAEKVSLGLVRDAEVMTVSGSTADQLSERGFEQSDIEVIRNGINHREYSQGESEEPVVLYLGRLEYNKGADLLPDIYRQLRRMEVDFRLEIAGRGRKEQELKEFAENREAINLHGFVNEERKKELLKSASVLIAPSRREGWGLTVSEANASGTPAVGYRIGGLKESILDGETGKLARSNPSPREHTDVFAEKVSELLEDDELREEMSDRAVKVSEERDWEETVDGLEELLADAAGS